MYEIHVLHNGYSRIVEEKISANCTCTLLMGSNNVIVDTMTPWDGHTINTGLDKMGLTCDDINFVVSTHGHSDHTGNNNLFLKAKHIVGFEVSFKDLYYPHPFEKGEPYIIDEFLKVIPTPGHTAEHVSVVVETQMHGTVVVAGDLFEREEDLIDESLWRDVGENSVKQEEYRNHILQLAHYIVPGHGPMFRVTEGMKERALLHTAT